MSIEKCKDFEKDGYGTWDDSSRPTTYANMYDFMKNQNNVTLALANGLWQPSTDYSVGAVIHSPSLPAGCKATCTTAGTTGSTEPKWTAYGTTMTDGTVKWKIETDVQSTIMNEVTDAINRKIVSGTGSGSGSIDLSAYAKKTDINSYAPLASPVFTGIPKAPTADAGTNTTQIATTAFVANAISNASGSIDLSIYAKKTDLSAYQTKLTFDTTPTAYSTNPVTSGGVKSYVDSAISAAGGKTVDLSNYYTKSQVDTAIANAGVSGGTVDLSAYVEKTDYQEEVASLQDSINTKQDKLTFDSTPTAGSSNPVTSAGIKAAIDANTVDLSNYYTKTQVDSAIASASGSADLSNYYTKAQVDTAIANAISAITDGDNKSY